MEAAHPCTAAPCGPGAPINTIDRFSSGNKSTHMTHAPVLDQRRAGILLHPTSLPHGNLGSDAYRFLDLAHAAGLTVWQTLPLGPTHDDGSPYHCLSVHALDPELISVEWMIERGWITPRSGTESPRDALARAYAEVFGGAHPQVREAFEKFCAREWLRDYALYQALRESQNHQAWWQWPAPLRDRDAKALAEVEKKLAPQVEAIRFEQFVAEQQWQAVRAAARERGIQLLGDMPIFVAQDSADVWAHRDCFRLDASGQPTVVAGCPPDYFSPTGQRWGNPLYDWERLQARGFDWWIARLETELSRFDIVRVDHFRGFEASWEIPASDDTAENGRWIKVVGEALFNALEAHFGRLPLVAEDLGVITPEVNALRHQFGLPGMAILQFAFGGGGSDNPYLLHNIHRNSVVYTGTHDNDTTVSWFESLSAQEQLYVVEYLGFIHEPMPWPLIRTAFMSVARLAIIPMQDFLSLGRGHRMNMPGTAAGNWSWRFSWDDVAPDLAERVNRLVRLYGRDVTEKA
jgi:4-alpha-glucanotransferase